jgi:hypothetical protein
VKQPPRGLDKSTKVYVAVNLKRNGTCQPFHQGTGQLRAIQGTPRDSDEYGDRCERRLIIGGGNGWRNEKVSNNDGHNDDVFSPFFYVYNGQTDMETYLLTNWGNTSLFMINTWVVTLCAGILWSPSSSMRLRFG